MNLSTPVLNHSDPALLLDRRVIDQPDINLLETLLDLAVQRVNLVLEFARNWPTLQYAPDYELHRATCQFHLEWLFDDDPTEFFTFRELCRFSDSPLMRDVEPARQRIRQAFDPRAAHDVARPVSAKLRRHVQCAWLTSTSAGTPDQESTAILAAAG